MPERVVVAVDGSPSSMAAVDWVVDRARTVDLHVEVLTVVELRQTHGAADDPVLRRHRDAGRAATDRIVASGLGLRCSTILQHDRALHGLLSASKHADLLVIGADPESADADLTHEPLRMLLATRTTAPVVVVPTGWMPRLGAVVVGLDGDAFGTALHFAVREAARCRTLLLAARGWTIAALVTAQDLAGERQHDAAESPSCLDEALAEARRRGLSDDGVIGYGHPSTLLAQRAASARLTIVGVPSSGDDVHDLWVDAASHDLLATLLGPVAVVPQRLAGQARYEPADGAPTAFRSRGLAASIPLP